MKLIIDTDIGDDIDDAVNLALALGSPEFDIMGVTTVFGDTETRARIARKLVRTAGRGGIPVVPGCARPLAADYYPGTAPQQPMSQAAAVADDAEPIDRRTASAFIVETVQSHPGAVYVETTGALTNVAAALCSDKSLRGKIAGIVSTAGYLPPRLGEAEWNVRYDPPAARIVAESGVPWTVLGCDMAGQIGLRRQEIERIGAADAPLCRLLAELFVLYRQRKGKGNPDVQSLADVRSIWACDASVSLALLTPGDAGLRAGTIAVDDSGALTFRPDSAGPHRLATTPWPERLREEVVRRMLARGRVEEALTKGGLGMVV
jgi:purine nucleosidase/pyrimidine-specific ribonucleoside hydrolase